MSAKSKSPTPASVGPPKLDRQFPYGCFNTTGSQSLRGVGVAEGARVDVGDGVAVGADVDVGEGVGVGKPKTTSSACCTSPPVPLVVAETWAVPDTSALRWATATPPSVSARGHIVPKSVENETGVPSATGFPNPSRTVAVTDTVEPTGAGFSPATRDDTK